MSATGNAIRWRSLLLRYETLLFAVLGLTADELGHGVDAAAADQITRVRAALQPPTPATQQRPQGYSFCIITAGQRRP